ncbi:hypothetical protein M433DRAFT_3282 [Acidomyces richmondensis BFW]|nr:MAG: hypothetical protein FE78DRAFT_332229 [Acidomyces sp. 'richmondensis']KYG46934.1 hypothetical protein M433DRAFT_3282 [Acidomyces richmondensis BFW]
MLSLRHRLPLFLRRGNTRFTRRKPLLRHTYASSTSSSRIARLETRLPRFLQRYTTPLRRAPLSHVTAFLLLHELTAVLPLFGFAALFHYAGWLPSWFSEGVWVQQGIEIFGRWLRKRGWVGGQDQDEGSGKWWGKGEAGVKLVVEFATAYAVTKALLPLRLVLSVWATPWFARWTVLPATDLVKRMFKKSRKGLRSGTAARTGAVDGGAVISKDVRAKG